MKSPSERSNDTFLDAILSDPIASQNAQGEPNPILISSKSDQETLPGEELQDALDREVDRNERKELILQRRWYGAGIFGLLGMQLIFMNVVFLLIGVHVITHIDSTTLRFYVTGSLGEIFGLVAVATRFVFSDKNPLGYHNK